MTRDRGDNYDEPCFVISVAARMVGMHAQSLRYYERMGIVSPSRSRGRLRLYSEADIEKVRRVQRLINELGVNLAGAEAIMRLNGQIKCMEAKMQELRKELQSYRDRVLPAVTATDVDKEIDQPDGAHTAERASS